MALCVVRRAARSCLRLRDKRTKRRHRVSVAIDLRGHFSTVQSLRRRRRLHGGFDGGRQIYSLAKQLLLDRVYREGTGLGASGRRKRGRDTGSLAGEPALWDLAQEGVRACIARNVNKLEKPSRQEGRRLLPGRTPEKCLLVLPQEPPPGVLVPRSCALCPV
jgi:hypothetical protein